MKTQRHLFLSQLQALEIMLFLMLSAERRTYTILLLFIYSEIIYQNWHCHQQQKTANNVAKVLLALTNTNFLWLTW